MKFQLLPERNDILPEGVAPKHIRKWLRDVGGVTPFGENRYRLILAECAMLYCGARWHDWADDATLQDMGGLDFSGTKKSKYAMPDPSDPTKTIIVEAEVPAMVGVKNAKLIRTVEEMRWIPRYDDKTTKGWMLQVWYPSSYYSPEHYAVTVVGRADLPLLGEFPAKGQYERQFFYIYKGQKYETFPTMPGQSWMERAIQHHERTIAEKASESPDRDWRMLSTLSEMQAARQNYERKQREEFDAKLKDAVSPIFSDSLNGVRIREDLAKRIRARGGKIGAC
jgi:hypothetical protein